MSNLRCIIIEDEPLAVKVLADYIAQVPFLELRGTFRDALLATDFLRMQTVDLMFLDIHLPRLKGMTFLKTLSHPPAVIITTAYHQYAVEGFDLNVTDYLLKPFDFERFLIAVNKVKTTGTGLSVTQSSEGREYLFLNIHKKRVKVLFSEIAFIESQREYVKIMTTKASYLPKISTHEIEALLPSHLFRRIHRSFIVNVSRIDSYTADEVEIQGVTIPVGRAYKDALDSF